MIVIKQKADDFMYDDNLIKTTISNLTKNNMKATFLPNKQELVHFISEKLINTPTVTMGGSMTLLETGILDHLRQLNQGGIIHLLDRFQENLSREIVMQMYHDTFDSDVFLTSSNAITSDGYLYNVDGNGNRVAAMIFGPKKVFVIAGYNKIVTDQAAAIQRIQEISAPLNAKRLKLNTPCAKTGKCSHCMSKDRICCSYVFHGQQRIKDRIEVIILGESYGY